MEKGYFYSFRGLFLTNFAVTLGVGMTDAFFSTYLFSLGGRGILLGAPFAAYSVAKIFLSPLLGAWSDRVGRRLCITMSLCLYIMIPLCFLLTDDFAVIIFLRFLQGIACALLRPVLFSLVGENISSDQRSKVMGSFDISFYAGLSMGPIIAGIIIESFGFTGIFLSFAFLAVIALIFFCLSFSPDFSDCHIRPSKNYQSLRFVAGNKQLYGLYIFIYARACGVSMLTVFLPIFLGDYLALKGGQVGLVMAAGSLIMALGLRPFGCLADRTSRFTLLVVGGWMVPLLYCFIPQIKDFNQILLLAIMIGIFSSLSQPSASALLIEYSDSESSAQNVGLFTAIFNIGYLSGPLYGAICQTWLGLHSVFFVAGAIGMLSVPLFICLCCRFSNNERNLYGFLVKTKNNNVEKYYKSIN